MKIFYLARYIYNYTIDYRLTMKTRIKKNSIRSSRYNLSNTSHLTLKKDKSISYGVPLFSTSKSIKDLDLDLDFDINSLPDIEIDPDELESNTISNTRPGGIHKTRFHTKTKIAKRVQREPLIKDKFQELLDDNIKYLVQHGKIPSKSLSRKGFNSVIFKSVSKNCVCDNIFNRQLDESCRCDNIIRTQKNKKSSHKKINNIEGIECRDTVNFFDGTQINKLSITKLSSRYIKLKGQILNNYNIELDTPTFTIIVNNYIKTELPFNALEIRDNGICSKKGFSGGDYIYNLLEDQVMISGKTFINGVINHFFDRDSDIRIPESQSGSKDSRDINISRFTKFLIESLDIDSEDKRYLIITNFLLQCVLVLGHLQTGTLLFHHGDYCLDNILVARLDMTTVKYFDYIINGRNIKVKNMGFKVMPAKLELSRISLISLNTNTPHKIMKYRIKCPKSYKENIKNPRAFAIDGTLDMYSLIASLICDSEIMEYILRKRLEESIMAFIPEIILDKMMSIKDTVITMKKIIKVSKKAIATYEHDHPVFNNFGNIFTIRYLETLNNLNYRLFKN
jgi:hypothetical protein